MAIPFVTPETTRIKIEGNKQDNGKLPCEAGVSVKIVFGRVLFISK